MTSHSSASKPFSASSLGPTSVLHLGVKACAWGVAGGQGLDLCHQVKNPQTWSHTPQWSNQTGSAAQHRALAQALRAVAAGPPRRGLSDVGRPLPKRVKRPSTGHSNTRFLVEKDEDSRICGRFGVFLLESLSFEVNEHVNHKNGLVKHLAMKGSNKVDHQGCCSMLTMRTTGQ